MIKKTKISMNSEGASDESNEQAEQIAVLLSGMAKIVLRQCGAYTAVITIAGHNGDGPVVSGAAGDFESIASIQRLMRASADQMGSADALKETIGDPQ